MIDDIQDKLARLAEGDLTIDPTVQEPREDYDELQDMYREFEEMNNNLEQSTTSAT